MDEAVELNNINEKESFLSKTLMNLKAPETACIQLKWKTNLNQILI